MTLFRTTRLAADLLFTAMLLTFAEEKPAESQRGTVEATIDGDPLIRLLPYDGIPAIDVPDMISVAQADELMQPDEPVLGVFDGKTARAYPTWVLDNHEVVNDRLGDTPIAATW